MNIVDEIKNLKLKSYIKSYY